MRVCNLVRTLFVLAIAVAMVPRVEARPAQILTVRCAQGRGFTLEKGERQAVVTLPDRRLTLNRRPSSLGQHFRDRDATLIVDGSFVAFVQKGDWDWQDCHVDPQGGVEP